MSAEIEIERRAIAARWAVLRAGKLALKYFHEGVATELKQDLTPVTKADKESEELLRATFRAAFPGDGFLGEEFGKEPSTTGFVWIIDPIDATLNFVRGIPLFATLVGLEHDGQMVAGFCYIPGMDRLYHAARGAGAFVNDRPIRVSSIATIKESQIIYSAADWFDKSGKLPFFLDVARSAGRTRGFGDFYGFVLVAEGAAEAMLEPAANVWDLAALAPIVEEAGGVFTDWNGEPTVYGGGALVGNPAVHRLLLDQYRRTTGT